MLALLDRHGIRRFESHAGDTVLLFGGTRCTFAGFFQGFPEGQPPAVPGADWDDAMEALERFQALVAQLPEGHPHHHPAAAELDRRSFQDWIDETTHTPFAAWYFAYFCRAVGFLGPAEPEQVSLLHVLWGQRTASRASTRRSSCSMAAPASCRPCWPANWEMGCCGWASRCGP